MLKKILGVLLILCVPIVLGTGAFLLTSLTPERVTLLDTIQLTTILSITCGGMIGLVIFAMMLFHAE